MRNLLAFVGAMTVAVVGAGWYLGWYKVRRTTTPTGSPNLTIEVDTSKVGKDLRTAEEKLAQKLAERNQANPPSAPPKPATPPVVWDDPFGLEDWAAPK